jgi:imidazolonepropionase-like amidohydrolase
MTRSRIVLALVVGFSASPLCSVLATETQTVVIRDATIIDTVSGTLLPERTIVIQGDRIDAIGSSAQPATVPDGATLIDGRGKFVMPGLIDAHVHLVHLADRTHVTGDEFLPLFLAAGVTSVRSAGDAIVAEVAVAHYAESHPQLCPRVFLASPLIDGQSPVHRDIGYALTDPALVAAFVADMAKWDVTTLKIYVGTPRAIGREVIREGHRHGMKITGHLGRYTAQEAAEDGIDCLEHIWSVFNYSIPADVRNQPDHRANLDFRNPQCQALLKLLVERQVAVDPTLVVFRNMIYLNDLEEVHNHPDVSLAPSRMRDYWEQYRQRTKLAPETRDVRRREILKYQELTGILHRLGVQILVGTDTPEPFVTPGFSLHQELEMLVASGLSPIEAIQAATMNNATILGRQQDLGSIEVGKLADLVILAADPTTDIRNTRKIETVLRGGIVCQPAVLMDVVPSE